MTSTKYKYFALAILLLFQASLKVKAFSFAPTKSTAVLQVAPPSWEELSTHLDQLQNVNEEDGALPLITLFRDTNGWCPFCERVWFALKIKNIPYEENLINLFDKPKWFTDMVPTALVPAILIHTDTVKDQAEAESEGRDKPDEVENKKKAPPQRTLIWESLDILKALDEHFPDTPKLVYEDDENYMKGREVMNALTSAGFKYLYNMKNDTLTMEEKEQQKSEFEQCLDDLETFIGRTTKSPFFLNTITGLDVEAIPTLERWRYQLPLTKNIDIMEGRPNLTRWFEAMDDYQPYTERVGGDEYSWTAVASTFLKLFSSNAGKDGGDGLPDETKEAIAKAEEAAKLMTSTFSVNPHDAGVYTKELLDKGRIEAAAKLISNHNAIVKDCTNTDPKSQQDIERADDPKNADWVIRLVAAKLLNVESPDTSTTASAADDDDNDANTDLDFTDAAKAAKTVASRLCVPRDLGGPAASVLRYELVKTASELVP